MNDMLFLFLFLFQFEIGSVPWGSPEAVNVTQTGAFNFNVLEKYLGQVVNAIQTDRLKDFRNVQVMIMSMNISLKDIMYII